MGRDILIQFMEVCCDENVDTVQAFGNAIGLPITGDEHNDAITILHFLIL